MEFKYALRLSQNIVSILYLKNKNKNYKFEWVGWFYNLIYQFGISMNYWKYKILGRLQLKP